MALLWALASLLSLLLFTWNTSNIQLSQHFTSPSLWLRYVDDTFCILNKDHINDFHTHLNSICSHIQFTIEKEHNFSLPFLDFLVKRNSRNGSITTHSLLSTTIYRKPTHTNRYLHYTSHHPKHQKLTVAKTLLSRVNTHITDNTQKQQGTYIQQQQETYKAHRKKSEEF